MGYPMTWKRFINRNGLQDGDYGKCAGHAVRVNLDNPGLMEGDADSPEFILALGKHWRARLREYEGSMSSILGDLRRLEADAVDESAICKSIERRTGIDADTIATVLKEFMST